MFHVRPCDALMMRPSAMRQPGKLHHSVRLPIAGGRNACGPRSGASLVELCVAMLLVFIVFVGWVRMNNIQAVNKESLRYAAVEKAAGMLEAVDYYKLSEGAYDYDGTFLEILPSGEIAETPSDALRDTVLPLFDREIPIGYQCHVIENAVEDSSHSKWGSSAWVVMDLFDYVGESDGMARPFASVRIFCGRIY